MTKKHMVNLTKKRNKTVICISDWSKNLGLKYEFKIVKKK